MKVHSEKGDGVVTFSPQEGIGQSSYLSQRELALSESGRKGSWRFLLLITKPESGLLQETVAFCKQRLHSQRMQHKAALGLQQGAQGSGLIYSQS